MVIWKIELEARSLHPNLKAVLLAKMREYKSDLNNLKSEIKRLLSGNLSSSARDELMESGMADTLTASTDQRARLMKTTEKLDKTSDRVKNSRRTMLETEEPGVSILEDLFTPWSGRQHKQEQESFDKHGKEDEQEQVDNRLNYCSSRPCYRLGLVLQT